jgi:hypothetical protein
LPDRRRPALRLGDDLEALGLAALERVEVFLAWVFTHRRSPSRPSKPAVAELLNDPGPWDPARALRNPRTPAPAPREPGADQHFRGRTAHCDVKTPSVCRSDLRRRRRLQTKCKRGGTPRRPRSLAVRGTPGPAQRPRCPKRPSTGREREDRSPVTCPDLLSTFQSLCAGAELLWAGEQAGGAVLALTPSLHAVGTSERFGDPDTSRSSSASSRFRFARCSCLTRPRSFTDAYTHRPATLCGSERVSSVGRTPRGRHRPAGGSRHLLIRSSRP